MSPYTSVQVFSVEVAALQNKYQCFNLYCVWILSLKLPQVSSIKQPFIDLCTEKKEKYIIDNTFFVMGPFLEFLNQLRAFIFIWWCFLN